MKTFRDTFVNLAYVTGMSHVERENKWALRLYVWYRNGRTHTHTQSLSSLSLDTYHVLVP